MGRSAVGEHLQLLGLYMVPIPIKMNTNSVAPGKVPEGGKATGNNYWYCDEARNIIMLMGPLLEGLPIPTLRVTMSC